MKTSLFSSLFCLSLLSLSACGPSYKIGKPTYKAPTTNSQTKLSGKKPSKTCRSASAVTATLKYYRPLLLAGDLEQTRKTQDDFEVITQDIEEGRHQSACDRIRQVAARNDK